MAMRSCIIFRWSPAIVISVMAFIHLLSLTPAMGAMCCTHRGKVAYYYSDEAIKVGACGFKEAAGKLQKGNVAAVSPSMFNSGRGCSACYKITCLNETLCTKSGATVVATDMTSNPQTEFVVPKSTFASLALPDKREELVHEGIVDIKYKRISCEYTGHNLTVKVDETSQYPNYLALEFLYQEGQSEISSVAVATADSYNWQSLSRNYGALWEIHNPPTPGLKFQIMVISRYPRNTSVLTTKRAVLPSDWQEGLLYDTGLKINQTSIGGNGCDGCTVSAEKE